ncbi:Hypothetical protein I595_3193 [Croceitalea dokdonensis DOKDO 023]|uniref:Uncharacterized protein n=1 Tax=Croceitalea dokdonensis DOKDO 023 TaxID=1300341 RepID=A0A0P7AEU0_9FLAO|nr:Hypothetical protein I595_3193 [Croceitalea dokdonensis DOKDO 023]
MLHGGFFGKIQKLKLGHRPSFKGIIFLCFLSFFLANS